MHQKKRKLFVLYSVPIWFRKKLSKPNLCNKEKLYLVSYSIPLSCMVVLLLTGIFAINPSLILKTSAMTIQDEWVVEKPDSEESLNSATHEQLAEEESDTMLLSESDTENNSPVNDATAGITFSIGGADKDATIEATPGVVAYREHTVTVNLTNADEYAMFISGNSDIVLDTNSAAKLVGMTNATTGTNIPAGQWGYGWDYTGSKSKEEMTYQAVPSTQTEILTPNIDATTNTVSFTGKLNFAGKFPEGAAVGNYTGGTATLALVVSPKGTTAGALWKKADGSDSNYYSGIYTMQEIDNVTRDGGFCKNNPIVQTGWTIELQDNRGPNPVTSYKIVKLRDGNCWMQENLRLNLVGGETIEGSTRDGATYGWTVPNDSTTQVSFADTWTNNPAAIMSRIGATENGNYYTWCAATVGTCPNSGVASASICPKGWILPTGNANGDFYNLFGADGVNLGDTWQKKFGAIQGSPYYFPAAGLVYYSGSLTLVGSNGGYWSSTAPSDTNAYYLNFNRNFFHPGTYSDVRYYGNSVRCIARY